MEPALQGSENDPRVGTTVVGRYFLHRRLGRGGMADVYEATRLDDDLPVALKLLREPADPARLRRLEREVAAAARLRHPGFAAILDSGPDGEGGLLVAMELVRGRDLARLLREEGPLAPGRAGRVVDALLAVLEEAHAAGVLHRDLKPANVMVVQDGRGGEVLKLLDFGIASFLEPGTEEAHPTRDGFTEGTPAYMSPEQIRGEPLDGRSDLYAVGALLFELIAGAPPFEAPSPMALAAKKLTEAAPPLSGRRPGTPASITALVARALERDRGDRPTSAAAMRAELRGALAGVDDPGPAAPRPLAETAAFAVADLTALPRRRRWPLAVTALLALGVSASVAARWRHAEPPEPVPSAAERAADPAPLALAPAPPADQAVAPAPRAPERRLGGPAAPVAATARARPVSPLTPTAAAADLGAVGGSRPLDAPQGPPVRLVRGELNSLPTPPAATGDGVLVLQATPWAIVSIDGVPIGETPREVRIRAGAFEVRALHPDFGERRSQIKVGPGERVLWSASFAE
jgi:serine/threonine-protein kinase